MTFGVEVMWQLPITISPYLVWLLSPHSVSPHLRHRVGGISTYKSEEYSVECVLGMIQDDKGEQKSDDKDLGE